MTHEPKGGRLGHDDVDDAVDAVARAMTGAELRPGFSARVVQHLDARQAPWRTGWRLVWLPAAGALALAAIWIVTGRPVVSPRLADQRAALGAPATLPAAAPAPSALAASGPAPAASADSTRAQRASTRPATTQRLRARAVLDSGPEPLAGPEPIAIEAIAQNVLDVPAIQVSPMDAIQPITIPPAGSSLPDPQRRDRQ